jgi:hypothetical protein
LWHPIIRRMAEFWMNCSLATLDGLAFGYQMEQP